MKNLRWILVLCWVCVQCWLSHSEPLASNSSLEDCPSVIQCNCDDLIELTGVTCHKVTDFRRLSEKLGDGSLFEVNTTYEITITGVKDIPSEILNGLIVFRLYIDDGITRTIALDAFKNVLRLRRLHVRISSIEVMPNFTYVSHSLRNLNFDSSRLSSLTTQVQNLPLLTELTLRNNSIRSVAPDAFLGTVAIQILDLSGNMLEYLPPDVLDTLKNLMKLVLAFNRLHTVHGLLKIARPQFVYLMSNNLTDADDIFYETMTNLEMVDFKNNPLRRFTNQTFNLYLPNLKFLHVDFCEIEEFDVDHYTNLTNLRVLDLSGNRIETIPNKTIRFGDRIQLVLRNNRISLFQAEISFKVLRFHLSGNRMRMLGSMLQLTQISEVEIKENQLEALLDSDLRGVHGTAVATFRNNRIKRVESNVFYTLRNDLQNLDLSSNRIPSLNGSVRYLSRLKLLNVSNNFIVFFGDAEFIGLNELSELHMQNNRILALGGQLQRIPQLIFLTVQYNHITTVFMEQLPKSLKFLYIKENPLSCDCRLMPFLELLESSESSLETDVNYCQIANETKINPFKPCPTSCSCYCTKDVNDTFISVDCHAKNSSQLGLPLSWVVNSTELLADTSASWPATLTLRQNRNPKFTVSDRVLSLDLEGISIDSLGDWSPPFNLKELRLARNSLTTLPMSVQNLRRLRRLTLSDNPWNCDCPAVELKRWMTAKSEGILDFNTTRCGPNKANADLDGKLILSLSEVDLCPSFVGLYVSITFGILVLLLITAAAKIAYSHYELNIKVWLFAHGVSWVKHNDLDKDKYFEAFISFSHEDEEFVNDSLVAGLESRVPDLRLCLHDRHFLPGEFIHTNIHNAVKYSKRTVLVLTSNFLESEWCLLEFRAAHLQAMEDKVSRIIVLRKGDLPKDIDSEIDVYLKSTTYVTWGEKYFWQKLIYTLPEPPKVAKTTAMKLVDNVIIR